MKHHWIEYLRTLSILAVIAIHITGVLYLRFDSLDTAEWWVVNVINAASRFCVPMFVMISGTLLLGRESDTLTFYKKRAWRIIPALLFWSAAFITLRVIREPMHLWDDKLLSVLADTIITGKAYPHLWYLSMFACLMLFVPFLNMIVSAQKPNKTDAKIFFILATLFLSLQQLSILSNKLSGVDISWFQTFPWYIAYFMSGYFIVQFQEHIKISCRALLLSVITCITIGAFLNDILATDYNIILDYIALPNEGVLVFLTTASIFTLFLRHKDQLPQNKIISTISDCSFGIYLIHPVFLWAVWKFEGRIGLDTIPFTIAAFIVVLILSTLSIYALRKIPLFRSVS